MAQKRLTIRDIAKMAGVSPTAVSFVINGRDGLSDTTRKRILAVIKETNFTPSVSSQRLSFRRSFNIALMYPATASPFTDLFYYEIASGLTEELTRNNYNVVFTPLESGGDKSELPHIIRRKDADGAIFFYDTSEALLGELDNAGIPYVLVDWQSNKETHTTIRMEFERTIYCAVMYLINKGHTKIAFFGSDLLPHYYLRCFTGYQNALEQANLPIYPRWIQSTLHDEASARASIQEVLSAQVRPSAVCCMSDMCAIRAIQAATSLKMRLPEELSFISIDDIVLSRYIQPQLTTISYNKDEIGRKAAQLLMKKILGEKVESVVIDSGTIIERQSVFDLST